MTQIVGVVGLGTMGAGIVQVCLAAGHTVIGMDGVEAARDNLGAREHRRLGLWTQFPHQLFPLFLRQFGTPMQASAT